MSVLNRPTDGQPNVLLVLAQTIWKADGERIEREQLLSRVAPASLGENKAASNTLNRWLSLGLFVESSSGGISFSKNLARNQKPNSFSWLRAATRQVAFRPENNTPLWPNTHDQEAGKAADLTRGIAWLLLQPDSVRLSSYSSAELLARDQFGNARAMLLNDTRWSPLKSWMCFLGFALTAKSDVRTMGQRASEDLLIPDPTEAVTDALTTVFSASPELPVAEFLKTLAEEIPVIDMGTFRAEVERRMESSHRPDPTLKTLSPSLSRALKRLEFEKRIRIEMRSDSPEIYSLQFGSKQRLSHLAIN